MYNRVFDESVKFYDSRERPVQIALCLAMQIQSQLLPSQ